jgi:hypothetical protein
MKKSAVADFFLNLSLKAKDFTRTECGFHLASARFHISPKAKYFTATVGSSAEGGEGSQHLHEVVCAQGLSRRNDLTTTSLQSGSGY